jgi:tRNA pseudouridine38-40 synthase
MLLFALLLLLQAASLSALSVETAHICSDGQMRLRFAARVTYDGSSYSGWQAQQQQSLQLQAKPPRIHTVQGTLNKCLSQRFSRAVKVTGASRTDQGVHARGQCIHFDLFPHEYDSLLSNLNRFEFSFNRMLPVDIRVYNVSIAPRNFHATSSAQSKDYIYRYCINTFVDPLQRNYCSHFYKSADYLLFSDSLAMFVGTFDFASFGNKIDHTKRSFTRKQQNLEFDTIRTIHSISLIDDGAGYFSIHFHLKSAMYKMVRNVVGACLAVAAGEIKQSTLKELLFDALGRRHNGAMPAPPEGLVLHHVYYDEY